MNSSVSFNHFGAIGAEAAKLIEKAVRKAAFDIEKEAKILAPVDTGFLRASIYTVTDRVNGVQKAYDAAVAKTAKRFARTASRRERRTLKEQQSRGDFTFGTGFISQAGKDAGEAAKSIGESFGHQSFNLKLHTVDSSEALVAVGAEYGIYLEFGTHKSRAQPFFIPAVQKVRPTFERAIRDALEGR